MNEVTHPPHGGPPDTSNAKVVYILYLVAIAVGLTAFIGVVMAYVKRANADPVLASHYTWQIRTFWIGLLGSVVGSVTLAIGIGFLILLIVLVWWVVRCVKGMQWLDRGAAVPDPAHWLFG